MNAKTNRTPVKKPQLQTLLRVEDRKTGSVIGVPEPKSLDKATIQNLIGISRRGFGTDMADEDVLEHLLNTDRLQLLYVGKQLVGFVSYRHIEIQIKDCPGSYEETKKVLYLSGVVMEKEHQGRRLCRMALIEAFKENGYYALALRTQNPAMYASVKRVAEEMNFEGRLFPSVSQGSAPETVAMHEATHIAKEISDMLGEKSFDPLNLTDRKTYGRALNDTVPKVNRKVEKLFKDLGIKREDGDSVIVVAILEDPEERQKALSSEVRSG